MNAELVYTDFFKQDIKIPSGLSLKSVKTMIKEHTLLAIHAFIYGAEKERRHKKNVRTFIRFSNLYDKVSIRIDNTNVSAISFIREAVYEGERLGKLLVLKEKRGRKTYRLVFKIPPSKYKSFEDMTIETFDDRDSISIARMILMAISSIHASEPWTSYTTSAITACERSAASFIEVLLKMSAYGFIRNEIADHRNKKCVIFRTL